jgi:pyruvate,water dikinase
MQDRWITDWDPSPRWPHYTRANAGEVLPTPASPLGWTFTWEKGIILGWRDGYVRSGNYSADEFDPVLPEVVGSFGGYFYINLANVRMQGVRSPALTVEQLDLAFFGDHPDVPPYTAHPLDERPDLVPKIEAHMGWLMSTTEMAELLEDRVVVGRLRDDRPDLAALSDAELLERARSTQPLLQHLFNQHTITSSGSGVAPGILFAVGQALGDPTLPMTLVAGIGDVDSAAPSYALWDLSRQVRASAELTAAFDAGVTGLLDRLTAAGSADATALLDGFERFVHEYGSRGPNEWEMTAETWETKPEIALAALDRTRLQADGESPQIRNRAKAEAREAAVAATRAQVAGIAELAPLFEGALVAANQLAFRERTKTNIVKAVHEGRMAFRELGRRHAAAGNLADDAHVFMLVDSELDAFVDDPGSFRDTLSGRAADWAKLWELEPPFFIKDGQVPPLSSWARRGAVQVAAASAGEVLQGVPGCPGVVEGRARIILDPSDPSALEPGDIMVAPLTDPAWTPLFMTAGGVVVNVGGQISHAIIVSRELGLPCVVSATDATVRIADGALVRVDGSTGQITVLELP